MSPSRVGRVLIGGQFASEVQTVLKIVAAEERTSSQALLGEGGNVVFARRHKAQIALLSAQTHGRGSSLSLLHISEPTRP